MISSKKTEWSASNLIFPSGLEFITPNTISSRKDLYGMDLNEHYQYNYFLKKIICYN